MSTAIDFVLDHFNTSFTLDACGQILQTTIPTIDVSATAEVDIDVHMFRNVFRFWTDSSDVDGISPSTDSSANNASDIKYYVKLEHWDASAVINPAHALVTNGGIAYTGGSNNDGTVFDLSRSLVKHDFLRYISQQLFNTHLGVDLFTNEGDMTYNIAKQGHLYGWGADPNASGAETSIWKTLVDASNGAMEADAGYYTNDTLTEANLTRELLGQLSNSADGRKRLADILIDNSNNTTKYADGTYAIPFENGDSVSLKVTLNAAANQHLLTGVGEIPPRTYRIKINLLDNIANQTHNIRPADDKLTEDDDVDVSESYVATASDVANGGVANGGA
jgi:hypothetical protein